jgi:hypothetical protein
MLTSGETLLYFAVQKKPVSIASESIAITNKRLVFCTPGNLGFTTNFNFFFWKDIKDVSFKEEILGSKFMAVPHTGENITVDYIPKTQARKLSQVANQQLENDRQAQRQQQMEQERASAPAPAQPAAAPLSQEDEATQKLQKLKSLFDRELISQQEYEAKKADILSQL